MDLTLIATVATVIATGYLTVQILSGKRFEDFLYSNEYANFSQYFFRPKSLMLSLAYGFTTAIAAFYTIESSSLKGYEYPLSAALLFFITFMLLVYNCWSGSVGKKIFVLLFSVFIAAIYWVISFSTGDVDLRGNLSTAISLSLFTGFLLAVWVRSK